MPKPCGGHSPWLDVGVVVTSGDDQDHSAAEGTMVFALSAVVPWAFRNTKAFQGIDQEVGGSQVQLGKSPGSILPHPSDNKDRVNKLAQIFGYKGDRWYLLLQHGGVQIPWIHYY